MKTDLRLIILTLPIVLILGACSSTNISHEEGGIGGTGNTNQCERAKEIDCNENE
ncbi:MAG: hypothetical protein AB8D52_06810 [Gammaproteobacteria bacterium]